MERVEFRLTMPNNNSWNGKWTGDEKNYTIKKNLSNKAVERLLGDKESDNWYHNFGDGWGANVEATIIPKGQRLKKSDGFCGYDWMVSNIMCYGSTSEPKKNVAIPG